MLKYLNWPVWHRPLWHYLFLLALLCLLYVGIASSSPAEQPTFRPVTADSNPWHYDFNPGDYIYQPDSHFCDGQYFTCISTFWDDTRGYVVLCRNGLYSHSGGQPGACSKDRGIVAILYRHT
jgi:hypothetical protein